jgi:excisionase family DNA binding protein
MPALLSKLRTVAEACELLRIHRSTLDQLVKTKQLAAIDVSSRVARPDRRVKGIRTRPELRFREVDLEAFIQARRTAVLTTPPLARARTVVPAAGRVLPLAGADRYMRGRV